MELGNFSVSLAVKDIEASKLFYEKLGFTVFMGNQSQNWLIMKNGDHAIGLFQGMFDKNILTFNPGWDSNARGLAAFADVRDLQRETGGFTEYVPLPFVADEAPIALQEDTNPDLAMDKETLTADPLDGRYAYAGGAPLGIEGLCGACRIRRPRFAYARARSTPPASGETMVSFGSFSRDT